MNAQVIGFVAIAVVMSAAAFFFVAWPVLKRRRQESAQDSPAVASPAADTGVQRAADLANAGQRAAAAAIRGSAAMAGASASLPPGAMPAQVSAARSQLDQLQAALDAGVLSPAQFEEGKREIGRRFLEQVVATGPAPAASSASPVRQRRTERPEPTPAPAGGAPARFRIPSFSWKGRPVFLALGAVVVAAAAIALYFVLGSPASLSPETAAAAKDDSSPHGLDPAKVRAMAAQLEDKLKANPNDGQGWAMLARSYNAIGQYPEAVTAYKKAVELVPNDPQLMVDYADALAVSLGRKLDGEPIKLVDQALELDPGNVKGLALKATDLFDHKDYTGAIALWERCISGIPANNEELVAQLRANIAEAKQLGGVSGASAADAPAPAQPPGASARTSASAQDSGGEARAAGVPAAVRGVVTLADSLAGKVSPNDTVFIFARPVEGPRMPVALLRKQVKDLPLQFTLDESMAMMPSLTLAQYPNVLVGARVAKSGDATPKSGDLEGISGPVKVGANDVRIEISRVVP